MEILFLGGDMDVETTKNSKGYCGLQTIIFSVGFMGRGYLL